MLKQDIVSTIILLELRILFESFVHDFRGHALLSIVIFALGIFAVFE